MFHKHGDKFCCTHLIIKLLVFWNLPWCSLYTRALSNYCPMPTWVLTEFSLQIFLFVNWLKSIVFFIILIIHLYRTTCNHLFFPQRHFTKTQDYCFSVDRHFDITLMTSLLVLTGETKSGNVRTKRGPLESCGKTLCHVLHVWRTGRMRVQTAVYWSGVIIIKIKWTPYTNRDMKIRTLARNYH